MGNAKSKNLDFGKPFQKIAKRLSRTRSQDHIDRETATELFVRRWNRASRRRVHQTTLADPYAATKTAWPVPLLEGLFLPEYRIKSDIDLEDFEVLDVIARGAFGNVLKVRREDDKVIYAVKVLVKSQVIIEGAVKQSKDEATIQYMVGHHPFIVKAHWYWQSRKLLYIVSDYVPNGELFTLWQYHGAFPENLVKLYIAELALVIDFLHNTGVVYRDIKLENILIDEEGHLQLTDFGLAKWLKRNERTRTICGTLQYIAPEILSLQPYGRTVDWWSLGVLMYILLTGEYPVTGASNHKDMRVMMAGCDYDAPDYLSWEARCAVEQLLVKDPNYRTKSLSLLQRQPFFKDLNFDSVREKLISPRQLITSNGFNFFPGEDYLRSHIQRRNSQVTWPL
ncbi:serine/threonine-protein kinase S6KL-like isoform X2 [Tubulanus polymorphus]|uniref:serine/threonine-protein kinase S6KL-like isoform X2 n=1 Tax=Tubulanus polymorphus TaxID=672921 RepID=UPI003DA251EE